MHGRLNYLWHELSVVQCNSSYILVIDQAWGQDGWLLAEFFFCMFVDWYGVKVHKHAKIELGQYPAIDLYQKSLNGQ